MTTLNEKLFVGKKLSELKAAVIADKIMIAQIGEETFVSTAQFDESRINVSLEPLKPQAGLVFELCGSEETLKEIKNSTSDFEVLGVQEVSPKRQYVSLRLKTNKNIFELLKSGVYINTDVTNSDPKIINELVITDIRRG